MNILDAIMNSLAAGDKAARQTDFVPPKNLPQEQRVPAWLGTEDTARDLAKEGRRAGESANSFLPGFEATEAGAFANLINDMGAGEDAVSAGKKAEKESQAEPMQQGAQSALEDAIHAAIQSYLLGSAEPSGNGLGDALRRNVPKPVLNGKTS